MEGMLGFEPNILGEMKNFDTILKGWFEKYRVKNCSLTNFEYIIE